MVKHTQTIRRQKPTNCLSVFNHFVGLALKGLRYQFMGLIMIDIEQVKFMEKFWGFSRQSTKIESTEYFKNQEEQCRINWKLLLVM